MKKISSLVLIPTLYGEIAVIGKMEMVIPSYSKFKKIKVCSNSNIAVEQNHTIANHMGLYFMTDFRSKEEQMHLVVATNWVTISDPTATGL